jgi:hypothetical protein
LHSKQKGLHPSTYKPLASLACGGRWVAAGDEDAVALKQSIDECGIDIPRTQVNNGTTDARQTQAVGTLMIEALEWLYKNAGRRGAA